ncbi:ATP-binding cassette sub-family C member 12-like [Argopecten irradians]|uniref:ATP-binding cassette sub-family C member 12-like n=1 Tax=Argopecten irradians TaxID=31199 RepID=UPI00371C3FC6
MNNKSSLTTSLVLRNIDIEIKRGRHIGICGAVGCGKSSLLQALIGRMPLLSGHLAIDGSVAYAAQQAWIFNGTLRENVLFGSSFKKDWYDRVIQACSLEPDLRILANGDMTEIGDRGINLSGGQKQRVSLARAVYSKRDIYLLDDPLSAVDVQVGKHLFHKCIDTLLKDKTVVLVTHQLQYLEHCDEVYVLDEGEIVEHGSHEVLLCKDGHYKKLIEQFHSNMDQAQNTDDISEIVDEDISTHNDNTSKQSEGRTEEKYKEEDYDKGILTDRETSQIGTISSDSYGSYIRQAGGGIVAFLVLLLYVVAISSTAFCEWWLGIWIQTVQVQENNLIASNESGSNFPISANTSTTSLDKVNNTIIGIEKLQEESNWYLMVYVYSTITLVVLCVLKGLVAGGVMTNASVNLHNEAVGRVMSAPMQYFDANPPGRLLNRFSRDVEEVDIFIPNLTDNLLQVFIMILASLVSTAYNLPVYLIAVFLVAFYVYIIKVIATIPLLSLKRLENVVRSPLISHVTTSCSGLNTIVSFSQENNFMNA